jgi:hypothetical protein
MKKLLFIIALVGVTFGCSASDYRHRYRDWDNRDYYQHSHFWQQVDERLLRQYHRVDEGLEHGRLSHDQAHQLFRHIDKLENRIEALRCENRAGSRQRRKILHYLDRNDQRIDKYLYHRRHKQLKRSRYTNPYSNNGFIPNRGVQWSLGNSSGVFYFGY